MSGEKTPSFVPFGPTSNSNRCCNTRSAKRLRSPRLCTPTRLTPACKRKCADRNRRWTPGAQQQLVDGVQEAALKGLSAESTDFWEFVSQKVTETPHSADACRRYHNRMKVKLVFKEESPDKENKPPDMVPLVQSMATQTDLSLPMENMVSDTREPSFIRTTDLPAKSSQAAKLVHQNNLQRISSSCDLTEDEKKTLSLKCLYGSTSDFISALCSITSLRKAIVNELLDREEDLISTLSAHPSKYDLEQTSSALFQKGIKDLKTFQYDSIIKEVMEFDILGHLMLRLCMPVSAVGSQSQTEKAVKRISLAYSILFQSRDKDLSFIQRLISCVLAQEHVHQKLLAKVQAMEPTSR